MKFRAEPRPIRTSSSEVPKIGIGADHRGFLLKEYLREILANKNYKVVDFGVYSSKPADYPDIAFALTKGIQERIIKDGILICGSGLGMTITANKVKGIRAALCFNTKMAEMARNHNNANVLVLAADFTTKKDAKKILWTFLKESFRRTKDTARHKRRLNKISLHEKAAYR